IDRDSQRPAGRRSRGGRPRHAQGRAIGARCRRGADAVILTRISINNPVFATMMMVALMVLGLFAYQRLGVDQFPNIDFPLVVVSTTYPGATPETVESDVTRKIEEAVNTISGVKTVTSTS